MPRISVIIPTYNRAATILACLRSVLEQDGSEALEIVVVDDGSTDDTPAALTRVPGDNLRLVVQENAGPCVARNRGAEVSTGEFLTFLDSDDELAPGWASSMLGLLEGPRPDLVSCGVTLVDVHTGLRTPLRPTDLGPAYEGHVLSLLPGAYSVHRGLFRAVGGFAQDIAYGEHHELGLRFAAAIGPDRIRVRSTPQTLVTKHHDRSPAVSRAYHRRRVDAVETMVARHGERIAEDARMLADYETVAGFSAASLGEYGRARVHFSRARRAMPSRLKPYLGTVSTLVPVVRDRYWTRGDAHGPLLRSGDDGLD